MSFAEDVTAIRNRYTLSQQRLGELIGVPRGAVAHWEQGLHQPRPELVSRLALVLLHGLRWDDPCYPLPPKRQGS